MQTEDVEALGVNDDTPLQTKLHNLEQQFTLIALYSALAILVVFAIRIVLDVFVFDHTGDAVYDGYIEAGELSSAGSIATSKIA